jgi:hypothetical protein
MTWTPAADAVVSGCARAAVGCPPAAVHRQRGPGCASQLLWPRLLPADFATPGWPSDPRKGGPLTSSIVLRDEDSSRDLWSRCRFAVRRPGNPVASPRSHGMSCRGFVLCRSSARLALTDDPTISCRTDISEEVKRRFLPDRKAGSATPLPG